MDAKLNEVCEGLSRCCTERYEECEKKIRSAPIASVLFASVTGYVLSFFPIGAILRIIIRIFLALIKPAILIFGALKIVEYVKANCPCGSPTASEEGGDAVIDSPVGPA